MEHCDVEPVTDKELEINGIRYIEIAKLPKDERISLASEMMILAAFGIDNLRKKRRRPDVNLVKEFELIQRKKSKLSRSDRDWVVFQFNRRFKKIT